MPDFIKLFIRKSPFSISMILFFLLFSVDGWAFFYRGPQPNRWHHWAERSKQKAWSTNWSRHQRQWNHRNWSNGDWGRWRRNNYYYSYGWGSPYYDFAWYGYQRPYYTTYWDSYPSTYANYTYPSYPFNGKWYTGSWPSFETPTQAYYNTGYYSGSP